MDDPVQRHPTRQEQLDILVGLIADRAQAGDRILDLGCGKGYVAHLLLDRRPDLLWTGVDRSADALAEAREVLAPYAANVAFIEGDLEEFDALALGDADFRFVATGLTFHDLGDAAKQAVIQGVAKRLAPDGYFLLYDRLRLTEEALFPLQQSIWRRLTRVHGRAMREAETYPAYLDDLGPDNRPASLAEYTEWFQAAGLAMACLHLHGNVALIAGSRRS